MSQNNHSKFDQQFLALREEIKNMEKGQETSELDFKQANEKIK